MYCETQGPKSAFMWDAEMSLKSYHYHYLSDLELKAHSEMDQTILSFGGMSDGKRCLVCMLSISQMLDKWKVEWGKNNKSEEQAPS